MYFRLEIELDSKQQCSVLWLSVLVDGPFYDIPCRAIELGRGWNGTDVGRDLATAGCLTIALGVGAVACWADG